MAKTYLMSTLVMGVLLLLVVGYVTRTNALHHRLRIRTPRIAGATPDTEVPVVAIVGSVFGILLLSVGVSLSVSGSITTINMVIGFLVGMLGLYVVWGGYHIARVRNLSHAQAVGIAAWFLGTLLLLGIVGKLVAGG